MKKGSHHSEEAKRKIKESHIGKRKTGWEAPCLFCGKLFYSALHKKKQGRGKYCSRECWLKSRTAENNPNWKGENYSHIRQTPRVNGVYKTVYRRTDKDANGSKKLRPEHIVVAEEILGRKLKKGKVVHHIDRIL